MDQLIQNLTTWSGDLAGLLWGSKITLIALLGVGLYLTWRLRFVQIRGFKHSLHIIAGKYNDSNDPGEISHFQALSTALSATVGTGNIAGVGTAIAVGGPGALFWMLVTAFFGMATKFAESSLSIKFRQISPDGSISGGPMYTLLHGLNMRRTAIAFATFAVIASFGIGNMVQANSVVGGLGYIFPDIKEHGWFVGVVMATLVGLVILGGVKRIAKIASTIVPVMALLYVSAAIFVLVNHVTEIPDAVITILNLALNPWAVGGGAIGTAIQMGVARGLFSNEAGLGSSAMAHAAAKTNEPAREGLVAMMEPFIDTIVICSMTGLVIIITGSYIDRPEDLNGAALTAHAFSLSLGDAGAWVVGFGLSLFAFSTIIAWSYYGDRSAHFLFGEKAVIPYRIIFIMLVVFGAAVPLNLVWNIADIMNILMAIPNLVCLVLLAGVAEKLRREYMSRSHNNAE